MIDNNGDIFDNTGEVSPQNAAIIRANQTTEERIEGLDVKSAELTDFINSVAHKFTGLIDDLKRKSDESKAKISTLESGLHIINERLNQLGFNLENNLQKTQLRDQICEKVIQYKGYSDRSDANNDANQLQQFEQLLGQKQLLEETNSLAQEFLKFEVEQKLGTADQLLSRTGKITKLKAQLNDIVSKKREDTQPTSRWSGWLRTSKNNKALDSAERFAKKALDSAERFAKNPALSNCLEANFDVNAELLRIMIFATYALTYFDAAHTPAEANNFDRNFNTPTTQDQSNPTPEYWDGVVNKIVLLHVCEELKNVKLRADGLIGSQNPTMQFWGKVLLALALAITATVAAIAIMSALGFALPTFLVPYVAYLQASALVTSVLTFVSTQLSITMAASASTTALLTAGLFGGVGYGLNRAGAPTRLKKDLDQAANDLDAAIENTPAFHVKLT